MKEVSSSYGASTEPAGVSTSTIPLPELFPLTTVPLTRPKALAALKAWFVRPVMEWPASTQACTAALPASWAVVKANDEPTQSRSRPSRPAGGGGEGERRADPEQVEAVEDGRGGGDRRGRDLDQVVEAQLAEREPVVLGADVADGQVREPLGRLVVERVELAVGGRLEVDVERRGGGGGLVVPLRADHGRAV